MALADEIADLKGASLAELDAVQEYFGYTKLSWRLIQQFARAGRSFSIRNRRTGRMIGDEEFVALGQEYVTGYLASAVLQQTVSLFEDFTFDFLRLWLVEYPGSLAGRQLELRTVLDCSDKPEIIRAVVEKELGGLRYESVPGWFRYLEKMVHLGCPTADQVEQLAELKATRDVLVHNKGVANRVYVSKSMGRARYHSGERVEIPESYCRESWRLVRQVVTDMADAAVGRLRK